MFVHIQLSYIVSSYQRQLITNGMYSCSSLEYLHHQRYYKSSLQCNLCHVESQLSNLNGTWFIGRHGFHNFFQISRLSPISIIRRNGFRGQVGGFVLFQINSQLFGKLRSHRRRIHHARMSRACRWIDHSPNFQLQTQAQASKNANMSTTTATNIKMQKKMQAKRSCWYIVHTHVHVYFANNVSNEPQP